MNVTDAVSSSHRVVSGFVREPDGRGTFGIVWSCVAVLILNTWTVLHLNIPPDDRNSWRNFFHKCKWWIICSMVPDGLCVNAYAQWHSTRHSYPIFLKIYPWWTIRHSFYCEMGGFRVKDLSTSTIYLFRGEELEWLVGKNIIKLPEISDADLKDRSKADNLVKSFAVLQSAWFLFQTLSRVWQHLPMTTLELAVCAFIAYTWLSYYFWWHKPMDLRTYTLVTVPTLSLDMLCELAQATCFDDGKSEWYRPPPRHMHQHRWEYFWWERPMKLMRLRLVCNDSKVPEQLMRLVETNFTATSRIIDWYNPFVNEAHPSQWHGQEHLLVWIIGLAFNGLHLAAWNFIFPTFIELWFWRVAVIVMMAGPTLWVPCAGITYCLSNTSTLKNIPYWLITLLYFLTRTYLLVEIFVGLRALEPGCYQTVDWTRYWPHF